MLEKPLVVQWNQLTLDAIRCTKTSPPLAARALAMVHTAMYDAWSVYDECSISSTRVSIKILDLRSIRTDRFLKSYGFIFHYNQHYIHVNDCCVLLISIAK